MQSRKYLQGSELGGDLLVKHIDRPKNCPFSHGRSLWIVSFIVISFIILCLSGVSYSSKVLIDRILAVVNDDVVTLSDLITREKKIYGEDNPPGEMNPDVKIKIRDKMLQDLIEERLIINEAKRLGLIPTDEEISDFIEQLKIENTIYSDEEFEAFLRKDGFSLDDFKARIRDDASVLKARRYMIQNNVAVSESEIYEYYETKWTGNKEGVRVKLSHIFLRLTDPNDKELENKIRLKAEKIIEKWERGESFAKLANQYTEDETAGSDGSLGQFYLNDLLPDFYKAIKELREGEIAGPVRSDMGYHILFLEERKATGLERGSSIWNMIQETIYERKKADFYDNWIEHLRKGANIDIKQEALGL